MQLGQVIVTPPEVRETIPGRGLPAKARHCAAFDIDTNRISEPGEAAKFALDSIANRIAMLDTRSNSSHETPHLRQPSQVLRHCSLLPHRFDVRAQRRHEHDVG